MTATGVVAAIAAWVLSVAFGTPLWARIARGFARLLAIPHAAFAIGVVALVAPSGWVYGPYPPGLLPSICLVATVTAPLLALLTWKWLQDADPATNARGIAAAWVLSAALTFAFAWLQG